MLLVDFMSRGRPTHKMGSKSKSSKNDYLSECFLSVFSGFKSNAGKDSQRKKIRNIKTGKVV